MRAFAFQLRSITSHLERLGHASGSYVPPMPDSFERDLQEVVRQFGGEEKSWRRAAMEWAGIVALAGTLAAELGISVLDAG